MTPRTRLSTVRSHHRNHAGHHRATRHASRHHHPDNLAWLAVDLLTRVGAEIGLAVRGLARVEARGCKYRMASDSHGTGKVWARQVVLLAALFPSSRNSPSVLMWWPTSPWQELCGTRAWQGRVLHEHWGRSWVDVGHCQLLARTWRQHVALVRLPWYWTTLWCVRCLRSRGSWRNSGWSRCELFCRRI